MLAMPAPPAHLSPPARPQPLQHLPRAALAAVIGVMTDIDDTLTSAGAITPDTLAALGALKAAGLHVIAVTGRPAGWSEPFALTWPLDAIVAENGAVAFLSCQKWLSRLSGGRNLLSKLYQQDTPTRLCNQARMRQVSERVMREVAGAVMSKDSAGRETDIAIDHSEFAHLPPVAIERVAHIMRSEGMNASVSSIHINGWFGSHDKLEGARWIVRELLGHELDAELPRRCLSAIRPTASRCSRLFPFISHASSASAIAASGTERSTIMLFATGSGQVNHSVGNAAEHLDQRAQWNAAPHHAGGGADLPGRSARLGREQPAAVARALEHCCDRLQTHRLQRLDRQGARLAHAFDRHFPGITVGDDLLAGGGRLLRM